VSEHLHALFVNENLGGHATMHRSIERTIATMPDVDARFLHVPPPGPVRRLVGLPVPGLAAGDADLQPLRVQLAQSMSTRRQLARTSLDAVDVVHAYSQNAVLLSARRLATVPTVVSTDATTTQHASMLPYRHAGRGTAARVRWSRRFELPVYDAATLVVAQSRWAERSLRDDYGVDPGRLEVIPFGIELADPVPRIEPPVPEITFVGQSLARKGGHRVLDIFRNRLTGRCVLNIVTRESVAATPGVRVFDDFVPGDPRLRELLARTAVLVFPTEIDTFGYAAIEAMAAGCPVIAARISALPEVVVDGETGVLVDPAGGDAAYCAAIEDLLDAPERRRAMGESGRRRAERCFDARRTTGRLIEVLREARRRFAVDGPRRGA
jgi:glycosyltransferase involved in cell wall biosynthesis